ncbi:hypothetical protein LUZ61_017805 [Rhynchospora tenuis]|uniref:Reverse transcriptase domain-containing protein n=1 Tax=Rhynchospora tenuis TaxID=198213 RepID=A0AAD5Z839_9POAL|nr:hypothetical protein LUZ61_017805 [Rhynchospora tenuis]
MMDAFNDFIRDLQLYDVALSNRNFTWSNRQPAPTFSRLDRVLLSPLWLQAFPSITLQAIPQVASDHCPLLFRSRGLPTTRKPFRLEKFWLHQRDFAHLTSSVWSSPSSERVNPLQRFYKRTQTLHEASRLWHKTNHGSISLALQNAKTFISFLDLLEELRPLTILESRFRVLLREKAFQLANWLEMRWHQRSRVKWLQCGDRNTRYFHAIASAKARKKAICNLTVDGNVLTNKMQILSACTSFFQQLLGTDPKVIPFEPAALYPQPDMLLDLALPFHEDEIKKAVHSLANDKASGPDGLPNEFARVHWNSIKQDILDTFNSLHEGTLNLQEHNLAHIVLLPKSEPALDILAFRPISIINYVPKLISKVLANRLAPFMPNLISTSQSGFLSGRLISENFISAREVLAHLQKKGEPSIMFKLDFRKAFDTVDWSFLFTILAHRGFPPAFIAWIRLLLGTAQSSIILNDQVGEPFFHKKGLRQGDPISPFLFLLATDVLSRMLHVAGAALPFCLSNQLTQPFSILQYADDTLLFSTVKGTALHSLQSVLLLFSKISGLCINLSKSAFFPINLTEEVIASVRSSLGCNQQQLPINYLGLPLTVNRPTRECFQQLIDRINKRLAGWKSAILSRAGRILLTKTVLSAMPVFFMSAFKLPKWVIKSIDKMRRAFIWGRTGAASLNLLAWDRVCLPKLFGGLGVPDLHMLNIALLLKWWWRLYHHKESLWSSFARTLFSKNDGIDSPMVWKKEGSFFWRDLLNLRFFFQLSTTVQLADGTSTSFWYDCWRGKPIFFLCQSASPQSKPPLPDCSVRNALQRWFQIFPAPLTHEVSCLLNYLNITLSGGGNDHLVWRWNSNGNFSVSSCYNAFVTAGKIKSPLAFIWKLHIPPNHKTFLLLLGYNRLLTQEQLQKRGITVQQGCALCQQNQLETAAHIFFECPFAVSLWRQLNLHIVTNHVSVLECLLLSFTAVKGSKVNCISLATALWATWLERNNRIFRRRERLPAQVAHWVSGEAMAFMKYC